MIKRLLREKSPTAYYNLMTAHDMLQGMAWRLLAPSLADEAFNDRYQMLYVVGCGRSGTTIFSHCLGQHRDVAELNEPLHIWFGTSIKTDIVSPFADLVGGRCRLDRRDVDDGTKARYRAMVDYHVRGGAPIICDKLPLSTFRVDYIAELCPNAKFILLQRSPRAVARSIEQCMVRDGTWWGLNDCKWRAISRYAESDPALRDLIPYAIDDYYRGLIEWRVGQELVAQDFARLETDRYLEVHYEDLMADPRQVIGECLDFAGAEQDDEALDFAATNVKQTTAKAVDHRRSPEDDRLHHIILGDDYNESIAAA